MTFNEFVGNALLKEQVLGFINNKTIPHCLILEGAQGVGKKTFADLFARLVLCSSKDITTCCECKNCKKIISKTHPDIIYPEKTGALKTFNVATVRKIREDAYITPNESEYKIYVFADSDDMNLSSQNALLKVLEEPPKNVIFIFTCKTSAVFLDTIKSRSQIFFLDYVKINEASEYIFKNYPEVDLAKINFAVNETGGNIGKALDMLKDTENSKAYLLAQKLAKAIVIPNELGLLGVCAEISDKVLLKQTLSSFALKLKDALITSSDDDIIKKISLNISQKNILNMLEVINEVNRMMDYNVNHSLLITFLTSNLYKAAFSD